MARQERLFEIYVFNPNTRNYGNYKIVSDSEHGAVEESKNRYMHEYPEEKKDVSKLDVDIFSELPVS